MNVHFSSATDEWATPACFFEQLAAEFGPFDLDPCANAGNAKAPTYFTREQDGLAQDWTPYRRIYMNPPYGRVIGAWVKKAAEAAQAGCLVVCLLPARTDTKWWHSYCIPMGGGTVYQGPPQVRRRQERRAIPQRRGGVR